jgi:hypothetical protein
MADTTAPVPAVDLKKNVLVEKADEKTEEKGLSADA